MRRIRFIVTAAVLLAVVPRAADGDTVWQWQTVDPLHHADPLTPMQITFDELRVATEMGTGATFAAGHSTAGIGIRFRPRLSPRTGSAAHATRHGNGVTSPERRS